MHLVFRDDENDESEEEERVDFTVATSSSESNLRKIQQTILEAHEGGNIGSSPTLIAFQ